MAEIKRRCLVSGGVQGVNYRAFARAHAREAGIHGWARNLPDGRVEVVLRGEAAAIEALAEWLREGPPQALVKAVVWGDYPDEVPDGFDIR